MSDITIKVSSEVMVNQANAIRQTAENTRRLFENIEQIINGSQSYWEGDAQSKHLAAIKKLSPKYIEISKLLCTRTDNLLKMAGLYTESENASVQDSQSLPSNIIF